MGKTQRFKHLNHVDSNCYGSCRLESYSSIILGIASMGV